MGRRTKPSTKRPARRMRRARRSKLANSEFASAKETLRLQDDNMGELYAVYNTNLAAFDRLATIAKAYQFYRVTKIEMRFIPHADTFTYGSGTTVPSLYWLIDRNENILFSSTGFDQMRESGAKAIRFDDKIVNVKWRPSVIQTLPANNANPPTATTFDTSRLSPWLPTNAYAGQETTVWQWAPSTVPHRGIVYGISQESPAGTTYQYHVEITMHVQYKKPNVVYSLKEGDEVTPLTEKVLSK